MGFNPARHIAIVALADANSGAGVDDIGRHVLDPALAVDSRIAAVHHEIGLPDAALDRVLGTYQYAPDDKVTFERGVGGLIVTSGPNQIVFYPETPNRFFAKTADLQFDFEPSGSGPPATVVLHQDGQDFTYKRVP
jgi:hypothetical protein